MRSAHDARDGPYRHERYAAYADDTDDDEVEEDKDNMESDDAFSHDNEEEEREEDDDDDDGTMADEILGGVAAGHINTAHALVSRMGALVSQLQEQYAQLPDPALTPLRMAMLDAALFLDAQTRKSIGTLLAWYRAPLPATYKEIRVGARGGAYYVNSRGKRVWLKRYQREQCKRGTLRGAAPGTCPRQIREYRRHTPSASLCAPCTHEPPPSALSVRAARGDGQDVRVRHYDRTLQRPAQHPDLADLLAAWRM